MPLRMLDCKYVRASNLATFQTLVNAVAFNIEMRNYYFGMPIIVRGRHIGHCCVVVNKLIWTSVTRRRCRLKHSVRNGGRKWEIDRG